MAKIETHLYPGNRGRWENGPGEGEVHHRAIDAFALNSYDDAIAVVQILANALDDTLFTTDTDILPDEALQKTGLSNNELGNRLSRISLLASVLGELFIKEGHFSDFHSNAELQNPMVSVSKVFENIKNRLGTYITDSSYAERGDDTAGSVTEIVQNIEKAFGTYIIEKGSNNKTLKDAPSTTVTDLIQKIERALGATFIDSGASVDGKATVTDVIATLAAIIGDTFIDETSLSATTLSITQFAQNLIEILGTDFISANGDPVTDAENANITLSNVINSIKDAIDINSSDITDNKESINSHSTRLDSIEQVYLKGVDQDSIVLNNETDRIVSLKPEYKEYLDLMLFEQEKPTIELFKLKINDSYADKNVSLEVGTPVDISALVHKESFTKNIKTLDGSEEHQVRFVCPSELNCSDRILAASSASDGSEYSFEPAISFTHKAASSLHFKLQGIDLRDNSFEATSTISYYFPSFIDTSAESDLQELTTSVQKIDKNNLKGDLSIPVDSTGEYVYFITTSPITSVTSKGFDVTIEELTDITLDINGVSKSYKRYKTLKKITKTLEYKIA